MSLLVPPHPHKPLSRFPHPEATSVLKGRGWKHTLTTESSEWQLKEWGEVWRNIPCKRDGEKKRVSDIDLVILAVVSDNSNLPPTQDEQTQAEGERWNKNSEDGEGVSKWGWRDAQGGVVPSSGAEKYDNSVGQLGSSKISVPLDLVTNTTASWSQSSTEEVHSYANKIKNSAKMCINKKKNFGLAVFFCLKPNVTILDELLVACTNIESSLIITSHQGWEMIRFMGVCGCTANSKVLI